MSKENMKLEDQKISLSKAYFNEIRNAENEGPYQIQMVDEIKDFSYSNKVVKLNYCRRVSLIPKSLFEVLVEFSYTAVAIVDSDLAKKSDEEIAKMILEKAEKLVNQTNMPSIASLIISNLTSVNGDNPLVTPPFATISKKN